MKRKTRNKILLGFVICLIFSIAYFEIRNFDHRTTLLLPEEPVTIQEAYMCNGPDETGSPTEAWAKSSYKDIGKVFLCVEVIPDGHATLKTYWIYGPDGRAFIEGPSVRIVERKYLYFSLEEAIENGIEGYYFEEEMESRSFPPGEYSVLLRQVRTDRLSIEFELTD